MIQISSILLAVLYAVITYKFSSWKTKRELSSKSTVLSDRRLEILSQKMAATLDLKKIKIFIYEIAPVNGLASPDGRIFITRGFMEKYYSNEVSAEELISVIAHELGHVALGHTRRRMIDFSGQNIIRIVLTSFFGRLVPGIGVWLANLVTTLLAARLSRGDEYEADAYASALLIKTGIGTGPQITLFEKLEDLTKNSSSAYPAWLLSHPKTESRISKIKTNDKKWQKNRES